MNKNYHVVSHYLKYQLHPDNQYIEEYLEKLNSVIESITNQYKRVLYIRFDLKFPKEFNYSDKVISELFTKLKKRLLNKQYSQKHAHYFWVREKNNSINPHYHCALFLDYNKTHKTGFPAGKKAGGIMGLVNQLWCEILNTDNTNLVYLCDSNLKYKFIDRSNPESKKLIFEHCAYLCKVRTKNFNLSGKNIGSSQVRIQNAI
ncbi:inovirus-type Gp2 protein [Vibrio sp. B1-2]|uniref:YagK/YfjJ domain-containing protein n=1 Tax=Vibrio sp. B1-2 TaxID=2591465 RepID=UPI001483973F|nr:inovirus-type Gp2 protein [Vibrio sp. B1-2]